MNWGTKIVIGMGTFMVFIVVLGILMWRSETDALVETDYYEKGLKYNGDYALKEQVIKDHATPQIRISPEALNIKFKTPARGKLILLRTSNKQMDRNMRFATDSLRELNLSTTELSKGQWRVILRWTNTAGSTYLNEREVILP
jgi:hypothetical protein